MAHHSSTNAHETCVMCEKSVLRSECVPVESLRPALLQSVRAGHGADWRPTGWICREDVNRLRAEHVSGLLAAESGELTDLEHEVIKSLENQEVLTRGLLEKTDTPGTFGERLSDRIAVFGGSWTFLITFGSFMLLWISVNVVGLFVRPFDPYPFILLNLILSCLAAVQAPIIMMSQNRQEAHDRVRAESDYKVNLKAELEIRSLHEKMDHLLLHQWQRLAEIQQVQLDLMEEILDRRKR